MTLDRWVAHHLHGEVAHGEGEEGREKWDGRETSEQDSINVSMTGFPAEGGG